MEQKMDTADETSKNKQTFKDEQIRIMKSLSDRLYVMKHNEEDMECTSWEHRMGVLISGNDALHILKVMKCIDEIDKIMNP